MTSIKFRTIVTSGGEMGAGGGIREGRRDRLKLLCWAVDIGYYQERNECTKLAIKMDRDDCVSGTQRRGARSSENQTEQEGGRRQSFRGCALWSPTPSS